MCSKTPLHLLLTKAFLILIHTFYFTFVINLNSDLLRVMCDITVEKGQSKVDER